MATYRILSLDGGGLRGLISSRILERLAAEPGLDGWLDQTDLFVGTSTGGILALALAAGRSPADISVLYETRGPAIFDDSLMDDVKDFGKLVGADYGNTALKRVLKQMFGIATLAELSKIVAITAFDLDNQAKDPQHRQWSPKIFHNFDNPDSDAARRVVDVALYTSAAPTYFPSVDGYIDGGVFANNPSMVGVAQAIDSRLAPADRAAIGEIVLLSVGTGTSLTYITGQRLDWGYAQWAQPLLTILMDGVSGISDFQCRQILGSRYHRVQIVFDASETIPLDAVAKLPRMKAIADACDLEPASKWLREHWRVV